MYTSLLISIACINTYQYIFFGWQIWVTFFYKKTFFLFLATNNSDGSIFNTVLHRSLHFHIIIHTLDSDTVAVVLVPVLYHSPLYTLAYVHLRDHTAHCLHFVIHFHAPTPCPCAVWTHSSDPIIYVIAVFEHLIHRPCISTPALFILLWLKSTWYSPISNFILTRS